MYVVVEDYTLIPITYYTIIIIYNQAESYNSFMKLNISKEITVLALNIRVLTHFDISTVLVCQKNAQLSTKKYSVQLYSM